MVSLLVIVIVVAIVFDYINGFHDAANAIATVVSTGVLPIRTAVILAGLLNFVGAITGTAVAKTIASGFAGYNLPMFIALSIVARGGRFFLLAFLLHRYGEQARHIIEKRLGLWVTLGAAVVVIGIVLAVYLI